MKREIFNPSFEELSLIPIKYRSGNIVVVILLEHDIALWEPVVESVKKNENIMTYTVNGKILIPFEIIGNKMIAKIKED